ncbi:MAG: acyltransferase, partial [Clostridiales bacterium]|nr:acyltransferase [Clostridiales bacterium]
MKSLKKEISLANALFCLCVLMVHLLSDAVSRADKDSWQYILVYIPWQAASAAVYGFIFLSALKLFRAEYPGYKPFLLRRLKKIVVPYLIAVTIYWVYFLLQGRDFYPGQFVRSYLLGDAAVHLYFVVVIVQFYLLVPFWRWLTGKMDALLAIPMAIFVMIIFTESLRVALSQWAPGFVWQHQSRFFITYLAFWLAGCYAGKHYEAFAEMIRRNTKGISVFFAAILTANLYFVYLAYSKGIGHNTLGVVQYTYFFAAILAVYALMLKLAETPAARNRFAVFINAESYNIYLYHMLALLIADTALGKLGVTSVGLYLACQAVFMPSGTFLACWLYRKIIVKIRPQKLI